MKFPVKLREMISLKSWRHGYQSMSLAIRKDNYNVWESADSNEKKNSTYYWFTMIKSMSRLLRGQVTCHEEPLWFSVSDALTNFRSGEITEKWRRVWREFGIENMGEYRTLYLKSDVLLLSDVFEEFKKVCLENYDLDPAWYYTTPGLA